MPIKPKRALERKLWANGYEFIAGVDEAGRGSWAGPIVAAAVILPRDFAVGNVRDSKTLSPAQRQRLFVQITRRAVSWAAAVLGADVIDRDGLGPANRAVLIAAVRKLHCPPQAVLVDAYDISVGSMPVTAIVDGDARVLSIAAASILAKVVRDELMNGEDRLYPAYRFRRHKGYGTDLHRRMLRAFGPSPIHRRSFRPVGQA